MGLESDYQGDHLKAEGENIRLMNSGGAWNWFPMHGSVTDLAVWDRILNTTEMMAWATCQEEEGPGPGDCHHLGHGGARTEQPHPVHHQQDRAVSRRHTREEHSVFHKEKGFPRKPEVL